MTKTRIQEYDLLTYMARVLLRNSKLFAIRCIISLTRVWSSIAFSNSFFGKADGTKTKGAKLIESGLKFCLDLMQTPKKIQHLGYYLKS